MPPGRTMVKFSPLSMSASSAVRLCSSTFLHSQHPPHDVKPACLVCGKPQAAAGGYTARAYQKRLRTEAGHPNAPVPSDDTITKCSTPHAVAARPQPQAHDPLLKARVREGTVKRVRETGDRDRTGIDEVLPPLAIDAGRQRAVQRLALGCANGADHHLRSTHGSLQRGGVLNVALHQGDGGHCICI